ncbi:MAG: hypothetical protein ACRER0_03915 [Gammaproteobacteria bacterium]
MNKTFLLHRKTFFGLPGARQCLQMVVLLLALAVGYLAFVGSAFAGTPPAHSQVIGTTHILSLSIPSGANMPKQS